MEGFLADDRTGPYVALGDSISVDDYAGGPGHGGASLLARNDDQDFPAWRGHDLGRRPFHLLATDGATSSTVLDAQLLSLEGMGIRPAVVTLTVGGNDVLARYGDSPAALRAVEEVTRRTDQVLQRLGALIDDPAGVVVGTVYDPSDGTAAAERVGLPPWPEVVDILDVLNQALRATAERHGAAVAEIHATFLGHGLAAGDPAQAHPRPVDRNLWYCNVIEPNAWGAHGVRQAFWQALGLPAPEQDPVATP